MIEAKTNFLSQRTFEERNDNFLKNGFSKKF